MVKFSTSLGTFVVVLDEVRSPVSVANFLKHVRSGHYSGLIFHRVVAGFVVQTGGFDADLKPREVPETIGLESGNGLSNVRGSLGMARTEDPDSATTEFYINTVDNLNLDRSDDSPGYAVFGRVVEGMETVDAIEQAPVHAVGEMSHVPVDPIVIFAAEEIEPEAQSTHVE